ncbi:MAG: hypothetical protein ACR2J3_10335 [Aridibacter sp.]
MIFHESVPEVDRRRIEQALKDIKFYGDKFHQKIADFIKSTEINIYLDVAEKVRGSGSVQLENAWAARRAVKKRKLSVAEAAKFVRLNIVRETINTGGQQGIEGTFVHEGKHTLDFALMLSTFSNGVAEKVFNPTAFQREYSAHLTSAFYLMRRGESYIKEGISLELLYKNGEKISVNRKGIRSRLKNNYGLTEETSGKRLNAISFPDIKFPRKKWFGIF